VLFCQETPKIFKTFFMNSKTKERQKSREKMFCFERANKHKVKQIFCLCPDIRSMNQNDEKIIFLCKTNSNRLVSFATNRWA
jgi:hypothetical protein